MASWGDVDAGDDKNFWRMADTGPCGPCSEIHFDRGAHLSEGPECVPDHSRDTARAGSRSGTSCSWSSTSGPTAAMPLPFTSVDTGMGLERLASVLQQVPSNYDTDLFAPIHARMRELLGHDPDAFEAERFSYQVIADHSRAVTFLIADGVLPSNEGRGYVLRRIVRRAVRHGRLLGRREPFLAETGRRSSSRSWPTRIRTCAERRDEILGAIEREEAPVRPDARCGHGPARGGAHPARRRPSGSSAGGPRTCRPTRRSCPATSRSGSTTRSASRST